MRLRIDLHIHTDHSRDSSISVEEAIRRCRAAGLDGFAVADHDTLSAVPEAMAKRGDLIVIPGVEVSASGVHILALGASESVPPGLPAAETVERIRDQGAVAVIAHPYAVFKTWVNGREIAEAGFDAVEVANAAQFPYGWMLKKNAALAERLGLPQTGGSDAHIPEVVGRAYTVVEADSRDVEAVLHAIRNGRTEACGSGITLSERLKKLFRT
ncbi:hypothetical protein DRO42_07000 [Candidatus Bathyarchaeota archaeon]|nr:MAG: hypothetical protein DRO42_07000 [Candidatus Bathyarchaeota archaeon]